MYMNISVTERALTHSGFKGSVCDDGAACQWNCNKLLLTGATLPHSYGSFFLLWAEGAGNDSLLHIVAREDASKERGSTPFFESARSPGSPEALEYEGQQTRRWLNGLSRNLWVDAHSADANGACCPRYPLSLSNQTLSHSGGRGSAPRNSLLAQSLMATISTREQQSVVI